MNESFHESTSTTTANNLEDQMVEEISEPETITTEVESSSLQSDKNPMNLTAQQAVHSSSLTNAARKRGRPLKTVSERLEQDRQEKLRIQQTENPSARRSSRLAAKSNGQTLSFVRGGNMLCLVSLHDCIERETDPDRDCFRSGKVHATKMEREVCLNEQHS